jgi:predicted nucleotidyltransferase
MNFKEFIENDQHYPTLRWVVSQLRNNIEARAAYKVLGAFIVGSEAKGIARPDSDLDIAVIIPPVRGKSALQISNYYQSKFSDERWKPKWNGRIVDIQFFYATDPELASYSKIPLI